jgi:hypothetical protein
MATSGLYSYNLTRNQLVTDSLIDTGIIGIGQVPDSDTMSFAVRTLNGMIKAWQADGLQLWKIVDATLVLEKGATIYLLGPTGDHWTTSLTTTTLSANAASGAGTISVTDVTGIASTYYIGIELDSGSMHWTTVNGTPSGTTVTLTAILTGVASSGNQVYVYSAKAQRPLLLYNPIVRDKSGNERPVTFISRQDYYNMGNKTTQGTPTLFEFEPVLINSRIKSYVSSSNGTDMLLVSAQYPIQYMANANDDFDFPEEWYIALRFNLDVLLTPSNRMTMVEYQKLKDIAITEKERVMGWDKENTSMYIQPQGNR